MNGPKTGLRIMDISAKGGDGLMIPAEECMCSIDDFAPCGDGPYPECVPALRAVIGTDRKVHHPQTGEEIACWSGHPGDYWFVPMMTDADATLSTNQ